MGALFIVAIVVLILHANGRDNKYDHEYEGDPHNDDIKDYLN